MSESGFSLFKDKRVLITGGSGELGMALVARLLKFGAQITLTTRSGELASNSLVKSGENIKVVRVDLSKYDEVIKSEINEEYDSVFHLVGGYNQSSVNSYSEEGLKELLEQLVVSTANLVDRVKESLIGRNARFVYVSTSYKVSANNTAYTVSKLGAENYLSGLSNYLSRKGAGAIMSGAVQIYKVREIGGEGGLSVEKIVDKIVENYELGSFSKDLGNESKE